MNRDPEDRGQPEGAPTDDEFETIVAGWRREGAVPAWPGATTDGTPDEPRADADAAVPAAEVPPADEEHFVPPEPPPLPPIGPPAMVGLGLLGLGLTLVITPGWLGVSEPYGLPLGLVGIAAGLGWLVLRLWPDPPVPMDGSDSDDGAVL